MGWGGAQEHWAASSRSDPPPTPMVLPPQYPRSALLLHSQGQFCRKPAAGAAAAGAFGACMCKQMRRQGRGGARKGGQAAEAAWGRRRTRYAACTSSSGRSASTDRKQLTSTSAGAAIVCVGLCYPLCHPCPIHNPVCKPSLMAPPRSSPLYTTPPTHLRCAAASWCRPWLQRRGPGAGRGWAGLQGK